MYRARIILLVNKDSHSIVKRTTKETCVAHKTCNFSIAFKRLITWPWHLTSWLLKFIVVSVSYYSAFDRYMTCWPGDLHLWPFTWANSRQVVIHSTINYRQDGTTICSSVTAHYASGLDDLDLWPLNIKMASRVSFAIVQPVCQMWT